jgi:tetratricopeptide (TPR) repeat protein
MFVIYGTRPYFHSNKVVQHGFCSHCNHFVKATSFDARRFFHLYFIPLIPTEGKRRNHKLCPKCKVSQVFTPEDFNNLILHFKERSADAVIALMDGESTFTETEPGVDGQMPDSAEPIQAVPYLFSVFDWLYASGNVGFCEGILQQLTAPKCNYARSMLAANLATMRGDVSGALELYRTAAVAEPANPFPVTQQAFLLVAKKMVPDAIEAYKEAIKRTPQPSEQLGLYAQMVDLQMSQKQFPDAVASYEKLIEIEPRLANEKAISKGLAKARKKAGVA